MSIESVAVSNIMVRDVKTAEENQGINRIAKVMSDNNIGSVVVVKSDDDLEGLEGIITERDIVRIAAATETSSSTFQLLARDIMSKPVVTIDATSLIQDAIQSMKLNNIRRLPVVDRERKMVGIIADKDIFRAILNSQSLVASISENVTIEYRPIYERLSEFMMGEMLLPGGSNPN
ncbi:MAG TPA: CBS domain-containing protein [Nitrososphaeraceae archaeon]|nr:CBS domain-containing protein [Nitrososphaeraceae archaeon]